MSSRYDARLRAAIDASRRAGVKALKRAEATYTTFDWADKVITAVELISLVGSIKAGAKVVFKQAVKKGLSRKVARKAATTYVAVQVTAAAGSMAVAIAVVPSVLSHAGLDEQEVQIGLAAFAAVGVLSGLAARPAARRAAKRITRPKRRRKKTSKDGDDTGRRSNADRREDFDWDETHPLIEGVPDAHRTPEHTFLQLTVADDMQARGEYTRVGMGRRLSEFSGQKHSPDIQPDNIGLTIDGKIDMIEIKSPSQPKRRLERKLRKAMNQLPPEMRGEFGIFDPGDASK